MTRYYKWMADGKPIYAAGSYAPPGEWQPRIEGELTACRRGYHILTWEQVPYWCGTELIEVEAQDVEIERDDKCVCRTWREVKRYRWSRDDMVAYAQWCASRAKKYAALASRTDATDATFAARSAAIYTTRAVADAAYAAYTARDTDATDATNAARAAAIYTTRAAYAAADAYIAYAADVADAADAAHAAVYAVRSTRDAAGYARDAAGYARVAAGMEADERVVQRMWIEARIGETLCE